MNMPTVPEQASVLDALRALDAGAQGIVFVVDAAERVMGTLTDGDLRRALIAGVGVQDRCLPKCMSREFVSVAPGTARAEVLDLMRARHVEHVPVLDAEKRLCGVHTVSSMLTPTRRAESVLILAGGEGQRLRPLTERVPKPMVLVAGRPILERLVLHVMGFGMRRIFLSVNYLAEIIEQHFGDGSAIGCEIIYLRESKPMGTGGPLSLLPALAHPVLVLNGDLVTQFDVDRLFSEHEARGNAVTVGLRPHTVDIPYGVATLAEGELVELQEKPTLAMLVNAGTYVFSPEAVAAVPGDTSIPMTQVVTLLRGRGMRVGGAVLDEEWIDIGEAAQLRRARGEGAS